MTEARTFTAPRVLLTVSGTIPPEVEDQVASGLRPRPDYLALADALGADLLDVPEARQRAGRLGRAIEKLAGTAGLLAWVCFRERRRFDAILTDGEQVGLPLALLWTFTRRGACRHAMIVHILSVRKKVLLYSVFRLGRRIDTMFVYSSWQQRFIAEKLRFPADQVILTTFMVDTQFFALERVQAESRPMICAAGLERRDYRTLMQAVDGLDLEVVIAAASPWSQWSDSTRHVEAPANVQVISLGFVDLRQLYADARFVVMPLEDVEFQAGVTTILEAMAMERAVVCSRTRGQTDVIVDRETGLYVAPHDPIDLRRTIIQLLDHPEDATRMATAARRYVERECDVSVYAERMAAVVRRAATGVRVVA